MKKFNIKNIAIFGIASLLLSGCKFQATSTDYSALKDNLTTVTNNSLENSITNPYLDINVSPSNTIAKSTVAFISVSILSPSLLDEATLDSAIQIQPLSDNTANKYAYPTRGTALTKERTYLGTTTVTSNQVDKIKTTVNYTFDSTVLETNKVAVFVDAAQLKDKYGNLVLNLDGNDKAGEESDSWLTYLNASGTTALSYIEEENFRTVIPTNISDPTTTQTELAAGKMKFSIAAPTHIDNTGAYVKDDSLTDIYNQLFYWYTMAADAEEWTSTAMTFTYDANNGEYVSKVDLPAVGTQYKIVEVLKPGLGDTKSVAEVGHQAKVTYSNAETKTVATYYDAAWWSWVDLSDANLGWYITTDPTYIVQSDTSFAPDLYTKTDIENAQKAILSASVSSQSSEKYYFAVTSSTAMSKWEDFKIYDAGGNEVPSIISVTSTNAGGALKIRVEAANEKYDVSSCGLYVGKGVTLNSTKIPTPTFGICDIHEDTFHKGYVKLN